jgi:hypothetical protein
MVYLTLKLVAGCTLKLLRVEGLQVISNLFNWSNNIKSTNNIWTRHMDEMEPYVMGGVAGCVYVKEAEKAAETATVC